MDKITLINELRFSKFNLTADYINALFKEARNLAQKYNVPQDYQDICQIALVEATRLEDSFDTTRGATFLTYVKRPIRQAVQKAYGYSRTSTNLFNKVGKFMHKYHEEFKVLPNSKTIATALGISEVVLKDLYFGKPQKISLDLLGTDFSIENEESLLDLQISDIMDGLTPEDSKLIREFYLEEYTTEELAILYKVPEGTITKKIQEIIIGIKELNNV